MSTKSKSKGSTKPPKRLSTSKAIKEKAKDSDASSIASDSSDGEESIFENDSAVEKEDEEDEEEAEVEIIELADSDLDSEDLDNDDVKGKKKVVKKRKSSPKGTTGSSNKKARVEGGKNTRVVKTIVKVPKPSANGKSEN